MRRRARGPEEKFEYYNEGEDSDYAIYFVNWFGQTFTPNKTHTITLIKLKLFREGLPKTFTVSIRATKEGVPNGDDLCVGTIDGDTLTEDTAGVWYEIALGAGAVLKAGVQYAIVCRVALEIAGDFVHLLYDGTEATYTKGTAFLTADYGESWEILETDDFMFEEWGYRK